MNKTEERSQELKGVNPSPALSRPAALVCSWRGSLPGIKTGRPAQAGKKHALAWQRSVTIKASCRSFTPVSWQGHGHPIHSLWWRFNLAGLSVRLRTLEIAARPLLDGVGCFINSTRRFFFPLPAT
jgi:hypothetical protein